jgi:hypothetical protein
MRSSPVVVTTDHYRYWWRSPESLCAEGMQKRSGFRHSLDGRGERIRTSDLSVPNAARCRAAPLPVKPQHTMRETSPATHVVRGSQPYEVGIPHESNHALKHGSRPTRCLRPKRTHPWNVRLTHIKHIQLSFGRHDDIYLQDFFDCLLHATTSERAAMPRVSGVICPSPVVASHSVLSDIARVAQWIERHRPKVGAGGSNPSAGAKIISCLLLDSVFRSCAFCSRPAT